MIDPVNAWIVRYVMPLVPASVASVLVLVVVASFAESVWVLRVVTMATFVGVYGTLVYLIKRDGFYVHGRRIG